MNKLELYSVESCEFLLMISKNSLSFANQKGAPANWRRKQLKILANGKGVCREIKIAKSNPTIYYPKRPIVT